MGGRGASALIFMTDVLAHEVVEVIDVEFLGDLQFLVIDGADVVVAHRHHDHRA